MKVVAKRRRSDSASAAVAAAQAAALGPLNPPQHIALRDDAKPYWIAIMQARARDTWTEIDLISAVALAHAQADATRLQTKIDTDGYVIEGKANPLVAIVETLTRRAVALSRALHVHAQATVGRSADGAKALANERAAAVEHDDLIPTLRAVK